MYNFFRPNGETQDETEERVLVRLKDGEEEEEIFTALFEDDDTSGMHVLGKMSAYNDRYQTLQQSKKLKKIAEKWLKDHDLFPWQKTVMEVRINIYNQNYKTQILYFLLYRNFYSSYINIFIYENHNNINYILLLSI